MTDDNRSAAHRDLVRALGAEISSGGAGEWLESAEWAEAVDRVRSERFPDIPRDEAFRAVGQFLAERYLASEIGSLVKQSLQLVPKERLFTNTVPAMATRLRPGFTWTWESSESGGVLRVAGRRVTPPSTTWGFFEVIVREIGSTAQVRLGRIDPEEFELVVSW